jgi:hypothetical protein
LISVKWGGEKPSTVKLVKYLLAITFADDSTFIK